ncbi:MAG TPA: DUF4168 domain-containing protein [Bacteroidales bacterium]|nr:DUF4168 domain-containing protein [Bacteroidales bacterium]
MKDKKISKLGAILVSFIMLAFTINVAAQGQHHKFTKQELTDFIHAVKKVIPIQKEGQEKMAIKIRKNDFTVKEYNDILSKIQKKKDVDLPRKRMQAFNVLAAEVKKIQEEYHLKIAHELNNEGLTMDKYDEILVAYQKDPEVKSRINKLMQENN